MPKMKGKNKNNKRAAKTVATNNKLSAKDKESSSNVKIEPESIHASVENLTEIKDVAKTMTEGETKTSETCNVEPKPSIMSVEESKTSHLSEEEMEPLQKPDEETIPSCLSEEDTKPLVIYELELKPPSISEEAAKISDMSEGNSSIGETQSSNISENEADFSEISENDAIPLIIISEVADDAEPSKESEEKLNSYSNSEIDITATILSDVEAKSSIISVEHVNSSTTPELDTEPSVISDEAAADDGDDKSTDISEADTKSSVMSDDTDSEPVVLNEEPQTSALYNEPQSANISDIEVEPELLHDGTETSNMPKEESITPLPEIIIEPPVDIFKDDNKTPYTSGDESDCLDITMTEQPTDTTVDVSKTFSTMSNEVDLSNISTDVTESSNITQDENENSILSRDGLILLDMSRDESRLLIMSEDEAKPSDISELEDNNETPTTPVSETLPSNYTPKHKYERGHWSPINKSGKKVYDLELMMQIKEDSLSKQKPDAPLLETSYVLKEVSTRPSKPDTSLTPSLRPPMGSLFHPFSMGCGMAAHRAPATPRDRKRTTPGKSHTKPPKTHHNQSQPMNKSTKPVIQVNLTLREEVKLNQTESAWKPTRLLRQGLSEEEQKDQEVYKQFRGILNKLTPQKFETLLNKVRALEITSQRRLETVIDLVFQKAIDEPAFSEAYAVMCHKLSTLKVPADNPTNPDQCVNFRVLIITKCQRQFETTTTSELVIKLEKEVEECTDPIKKKELQLLLNEENRRIRMRSVGNVRFIGELYKRKMLTSKIMNYCMRFLVEKLEEEKLECLCKLLTTIGQQLENESKHHLDSIMKEMQEIVDKKSKLISSRIKFMIQDVIELRRRRWLVKSIHNNQPKPIDQV